MINVEGEVKLIDFGLAESGRHGAESVGTMPAPGATVMGKTAYMAPEQARGEIVDARADQFAAGIIAYELITGERYYAGLTSEQVWQQAGAGHFKPAGIVGLPKGLRELVEKSLSPAREDRFATCGELREALLAYARKNDVDGGARELRVLVRELFAADLAATRELLQRFARVTANGSGSSDDTEEDVFSIAMSTSLRTTLHDPTELVARSGEFERPQAPQLSRVSVLAIAAVIAVAGLGGGVLLALREPTSTVVIAGSPQSVGDSPKAPAPTTSNAPAAATGTPAATSPASPTAAAASATAAPGPEPVESGSSSNAKRTPKRAVTRKVESSLDMKMHYVAANCPTMQCTLTAKGQLPHLGDLSADDTSKFMTLLRSCYEACRSTRGK